MTHSVLAPPMGADQDLEDSRSLDRSAVSWANYQAARDNWLGLSGFIFMPYLATVIIGDPVKGQTFSAGVSLAAAFIVAVVAPLLGATVDQLGPRKPWLLAVTSLLVPVIASLWFAKPDGDGLSLTTIATILVALHVLLASGEVLFSSMLAFAVKAPARSRASGLALSLGNVYSFVVTILLLWAFVLPGDTSSRLVPENPLFGLSKAAHEPDRIVPLVAAACMAMAAIPFFLFARDAPKRDAPSKGLRAALDGLRALIALLRNARHHKDAMIYLAARTVSQDGAMVILTLSGVYAAGVMKWGMAEMLVYGLIATIAGFAGGFVASILDDLLGPKRALQTAIAGTIIGLVCLLGTSRERIMYVFAQAADAGPVWNGPILNTLPELVFVGFAFFGVIFQTAAWSSSRTLLTRLAPREHLGSFFGLAALAGATTGWIGPLLAGLFTTALHSQRAGFVPVVVMLLMGLVGLFWIKGGGRVQQL